MTSLVTPGYAPFEQYHDAEGKQEPWTDIYAFGATCYSAITGRPPIDALKRGMARLDHSTDAYLSLVDLKSGQYSEQFLQAIDSALEFKEADRPQTVSQWKSMLPGQEPLPESEVLTVIPPTVSIPTKTNTEKTHNEKTHAVTEHTVSETSRTEEDETASTLLIDSAAQTLDIELTATGAPAQTLAPKITSKGKLLGLLALGIAGIVLVIFAFLATGDKTAEPGKTVEIAEKVDEHQALDSADKPISNKTANPLTKNQPVLKEQNQEEILPNKAIEDKQLKAEASRQFELARLAEEKKQQETLARKLAEQEQKEILAKKEAERKRQELLQKQAAEKKRQAAIAKKAAEKKRLEALAAKANIPPINVSGTYLPASGYEDLVLTQTGSNVKGRVGDLSSGNTLTGSIQGNKLSFSFQYSQTGSGHKTGNGSFTVSSDGNKLTGLLRGGGLAEGKQWIFHKVQGAQKTQNRQTTQQPQKSISRAVSSKLAGSYMPDDSDEVLVLALDGKRVKGRIGQLGSTLSGEISGNKINFTFMYTKTGYSLSKGTGVFTISSDGKRLSGIRNNGRFSPGSSWNLTKFSD